MTDIVAIRALAVSVRKAILDIPASERPSVFENFPKGSCGWASLLLGAFLKDTENENFEYICGERLPESASQSISHAWLKRQELIVDITADQFSDAPEAVIVSESSSWHSTFKFKHTEPADFRESLGPATYPLLAVYKRVKAKIAQKTESSIPPVNSTL